MEEEEPQTFEIEAFVGKRTHDAIIRVTVPHSPVGMTPATAREIGGNLIDAAARAEAELALYRTMDTVMGDDEQKEQMAALVIGFYRGVQVD